MKTMAEVLAVYAVAGMSGGTHLACRCNRAWVPHAEYRAHLEAALSAAGFGPVQETRAQALRDAADKILTNDPLDYWDQHLPDGLGWQDAMSRWLEAHAKAVEAS